MKKFLRSLTPTALRELARNYSLQDEPRTVQIDKLADLFAGYGIRVSDVRHRYGL